jgi:hypothetical protein
MTVVGVCPMCSKKGQSERVEVGLPPVAVVRLMMLVASMRPPMPTSNMTTSGFACRKICRPVETNKQQAASCSVTRVAARGKTKVLTMPAPAAETTTVANRA